VHSPGAGLKHAVRLSSFRVADEDHQSTHVVQLLVLDKAELVERSEEPDRRLLAMIGLEWSLAIQRLGGAQLRRKTAVVTASPPPPPNTVAASPFP
jgi:hypothetical protein